MKMYSKDKYNIYYIYNKKYDNLNKNAIIYCFIKIISSFFFFLPKRVISTTTTNIATISLSKVSVLGCQENKVNHFVLRKWVKCYFYPIM